MTWGDAFSLGFGFLDSAKLRIPCERKRPIRIGGRAIAVFPDDEVEIADWFRGAPGVVGFHNLVDENDGRRIVFNGPGVAQVVATQVFLFVFGRRAIHLADQHDRDVQLDGE